MKRCLTYPRPALPDLAAPRYLPNRRYPYMPMNPALPGWLDGIAEPDEVPVFTLADPGRTVIVSTACYPDEKTAADVGRWLLASARQHGIDPILFGIGQTWGDFFLSKVLRLRQWIQALDERWQHVIFLDFRDTAVLAPMAEICEGFNEFRAPVVIGAERWLWPNRDVTTWKARFPEQPHGRRFLNSGQWMGSKESLNCVLSSMIRAWQGIAKRTPDYDGWPLTLRDDQFLWQVIYLDGFPLALDTECRLLGETESDVSRAEITKGRIQCQDTGTWPCTFHWPGPQQERQERDCRELFGDEEAARALAAFPRAG